MPQEPEPHNAGARSPANAAGAAAPLGAAAICLLAFGLRVHRLGAQSFWLDEGGSRWFAAQPLAELLPRVFSSEPNPPLYYLLLHGWLRVVGETEFAIRFLSLLLGVLLVALVFRLGADLGSPAAGGLAAMAAAVAPFLIWYSQEARMYALLAACSAAAALCLWRALARGAAGRGAGGYWWGFLVAALLALYAHVYAVFLVLGAGLAAVLLVGWRARLRTLLPLGAGLAAGYLPWLLSAVQYDDPSANWRAPMGAVEVVDRTLAVLAHGGFAPAAWGAAMVLAVWLLVLVGPLATVRPGGPTRVRPHAGLFVICLLLAPLLAIALVSQERALFADRYVIVLAAPLYLAVGLGAWTLARRWRPVGVGLLGLLLVGSLLAWCQSWSDVRFAKEDYRGAADYVQRYATPADLVLLVADYVRLPFAYYYREGAQVLPYAGDYGRPADYLPDQLAGKRRLWLLLSHAEQVDPQGRVKDYLAARYPAVTEVYPQGIHLYGYNLAYRLDRLPAAASPQAVVFGDRVKLVGMQVDATAAATDRHLHPPSGWVHVTLYWQALRPLDAGYRSLARLVDGRGVWGVKLERAGGTSAFYPSDRWQPGEIVVDDLDVNLNPATPPGELVLEVGLVGPDGQPLPVLAGSPAVGRVSIVP